MRKRWFFLLALFVCLKFFLFPSNHLSVFALDLPEPVGYVNDYQQLLSPSFIQELESDLRAFEEETRVEIAVAIVEDLQDTYLEDYATRLFEKWQVGKEGLDNGLLLLIVAKERKIKIETGYGIEAIITDGRAGRIIREQMTPAFKEENYEEGIRLAVNQIKEYIRAGEPPAGAEQIEETAQNFLPMVIFAVILLIYFSSFWARSKRIWPGGVVGGLMGFWLGAVVGSFLFLPGLALMGFFLDWLLSQNYKKRKKTGKPTDFFSSRGGFSTGSKGGFFSGGGRSGGGFGGFGGGRSGGGGASGGW